MARSAGRSPAAPAPCSPIWSRQESRKWLSALSNEFANEISPVKKSESQFLDIRGLKYHIRRWPSPGAPKMVLLHGWMDVSASFQFLVDALRCDWDVYAPDWRGYGLTGWGRADCYWLPDYIADLDFILQQIETGPVNLVGHSLGGNVAAIYAGVRTGRVAKLVNLEGFGMQATRPEQAPKRYARWLDELREPS